MKADYIIRGGLVIDPAAGCSEVRDVVICGSRIADPGEETLQCSPDRIIDASGMIVTPGLVDFHTHLFHTGSSICIHPDMMIAQGTTAAVDAGSAGTSNYEAFVRTVIDPSLLRIKGFLTVYSGGQLDPKLVEDFNPELYNMDRMIRIIENFGDTLLGLKIRISRGVVPDDRGVDYLKAAVDLAEELEQRTGKHLRVCVHTTNAPVPAGDLAEILRPGDIFCHCFQGAGSTILNPDGSVSEKVLEARKRGVLFDAANGKGNFGLKTAEAALAAGFLPDIISTDLTVDKFNMPPYDKNFPLVLSKYLALGLDLPTLIRAASEVPARIMGMEGQIGTLQPGALADIAVFQLKDRSYIQKDFCDDALRCTQILVPQLTMIGGEIQYCQSDFYL